MPVAWQRRAALVDLDAIAARWQRALDAAQRAVQLATAPPIAAHVVRDGRAITNERTAVSAELRRLARLQESSPPWAAPACPLSTPRRSGPTGRRARSA